MISKQKIKFFIRLSIAIAIAGILFKIMHWPFAPVLLIIGVLGIAVFYTFKFYQKKPKRALDYSRFFLLISFLLYYIFHVFHLRHGYIFAIIMQLAFVIFLILYLRDVLFVKTDVIENDTPVTKTNTRKKVVTFFLYSISSIGIIVGAQFKILHWEYGFITGDILLTAGLLAAIVLFFIDSSDS